MDSWNSKIKSAAGYDIHMIQKLSVVSVLTLVVLAAAGSLVVATSALGGSGSPQVPGGQVLLPPTIPITTSADNSSTTASQAPTQTTSHATVVMTTVTITLTSSTSTLAPTSSTNTGYR